MSLETELEPKLAEIFRLAYERFGEYLEGRGYALDQEGLVVPYAGPERVPPSDLPPAGGEQELQNEWQAYSSSLGALVERFRTFYMADTAALGAVKGILGDASASGFDVVSVLKAADHRMDAVGTLLGIMTDPQGNPGEPGWRIPEPRGPTNLESLHWDGPSARTFYNTLLRPFRHFAIPRQIASVLELTVAVQAYFEVCEHAAAGIKLVADSCIAALGGGTAADLDEVSTFLGKVDLLLGAVELIGLGTGIVGTLIGAGASPRRRITSAAVWRKTSAIQRRWPARSCGCIGPTLSRTETST